MRKQNDLTARAACVYASLLRLYPQDHRRAFGAQMLQTFKDQYRDASEQSGKVSIAFWFDVISDAVKSIAKERMMRLSARRILLILLLLGVIEFAAIAFANRLKRIPVLLDALRIVPLLAILSAILLVVILLQRWVKKWPVVAVIFLAVSALGIFGLQSAVQGASTSTWCTTAHTAVSQPPAALVTATDYFTQGDYDYDRGDCTQAIADYSQAINLDPTFAEAYNNRAYTAMMQQEYARALPDLDRAIQLRPDYVHALMNRGDIFNYYYDINRARAISDYDRVIALGPKAMAQTSVCGHRFLAVHNGWNLGTVLDFAHARC